MKSIALFLLTLGAFIAIYFWVHFDKKDSSASWFQALFLRLAARLSRKQQSTEIEQPTPNFDCATFEGTNLNYQNDLESEKVNDVRIEEHYPEDDDVEQSQKNDVGRGKVWDKRRELEKLKCLMDKAKAVPTQPGVKKRVSRSAARMAEREIADPDSRLRSKLNHIERAIKARRGGGFLEIIPEALQSTDSFTN